MWFDLNLIKKGLVSLDQMLIAVKRQQLGRPPIGRMAVVSGKMSISQVFAVLKEQADNPKSFGQIAIAKNYLTEEDLAHLLYLQSHAQQPLGEILVEMGCISREQMEEERRSFHRQLTTCLEAFDGEEDLCAAKGATCGSPAGCLTSSPASP